MAFQLTFVEFGRLFDLLFAFGLGNDPNSLSAVHPIGRGGPGVSPTPAVVTTSV